MKKLCLAAVLVAVAHVCGTSAAQSNGPAAAQSQAPATAAAFGALPQTSNVAISPDGSAIAYIGQAPAGRALVIQSLAGGQDVVTVFSSGKVRNVAWAANDIAVVTASATWRPVGENRNRFYEIWQSIAVDAKTGERRYLKPSQRGGGFTDFTVESFADDGSGDAVVTTWESGRPTTYRISTRTGATRKVSEGGPKTYAVLLRGGGEIAARIDIDEAAKTFSILAPEGKGWKAIFQTANAKKPPISFAGLGASHDKIFVVDRRGDTKALKSLDLVTGSLEPVAAAAGPFETQRTDDFANTLVAIVDSGFNPKTTWIDPMLKAVAEKADRAFKGKIVEIESWTKDRSRVVLRVSADDMPPIYYLLDVAAMRADIIGEEYPQLAGQAFGAKQSIAYPARDGTAIPAYLTVPRGKPATGLPMIVMPHGGPESHDDPGFDWMAQFFATRGYAVLQPQFRGSSGLGPAWADAGRGEWGGRMQDDLTDGVKAMVAKGLADPKRICIVGASYGGYAALAGAAFTPDLYACAASVNGVSNLAGMLGYLKKMGVEDSSVFSYWIEHFGRKSDAALAAASPVNAAAAMKARILLVTGRDDTIVPPDQTLAMAAALKRIGKSATLVELEGEDHWMSSAAMRTRTLDEIDALLRQTIGKPSAR